MATNKLIYNGTTYEDEITANSAGLDMSHAMVGETLSVDELTIPVITGDLPERFIPCKIETKSGESVELNTINDFAEVVLSGKSQQTVTVQGKNLIDVSREIVGMYGYSDGSFNNISTRRSIKYIPISTSNAYTFSYRDDVHVNYYDSTKTRISGQLLPYISTSGAVGSVRLTVPVNTNYVTLSYSATQSTIVQLEIGTIATAYAPFVPNSPSPDYPSPVNSAGNCNLNISDSLGVRQSIILPALPKIGTVAATYNPVTGENVERIGSKVFDGTESFYSQSGNISYIYLTGFVPTVKAFSQVISTHLIYVNNVTTTPIGYIGTGAAGIAINVGKDSIDGTKAFLAAQYAAGHPVTVYYQLATPITTTLTPEQIPTYYPYTKIEQDGDVKADMTVTARTFDEADWFITADGYEFCAREVHTTPQFISNGAGLYYFNGTLIGKYFLNELHQTGQYEHEMIFYSAIRLLDRSKHFGGLYTGETVAVVLASIMGDVAYTVDDDIAAIQVYGYLPHAKRRNNLQCLLMAIGGAVRNNSDGTLRITSLSETVTGTFNTDRVFIGGSVVDKTPCTAVQVTEHNYIESTDVETLYENTSITTETITFSDPHHDYVITGGTIIASGVNFVTFTGAGLVTITGQKYIHITRIITVGTTPTGADSDVVKSVTGNTLLSPNNAADVAQNLYNYLTVAQSIKAEVVFGSERPGDVVSIIHPYTREYVSATIKSMGISMGLTELRANSEFLVGYIPPSAIAGFENYVLLTGAGNWTIPAGVTKIRLILDSGGQGGHGGNTGEDGSTSNGGSGGVAGTGGLGGLIMEINLNVTAGAVFAYVSGAGGAGGASDAAGSDGAASTFGAYSSVTGRRYPYGYPEPKTLNTLGETGGSGIIGGNGSSVSGDGDSVTYEGTIYTPGTNGTNVGTFAFGGRGGGAAVAANGGNGGNASYAIDGGTGQYIPTHGSGGDGADSTVAGNNATRYGQGGQGGHGGGGGGQSMGYDFSNLGVGGSGSLGGQGGNGCIVIYY